MKEKLAAIHNQALQILETVGIKLHHAGQLHPGVGAGQNALPGTHLTCRCPS